MQRVQRLQVLLAGGKSPRDKRRHTLGCKVISGEGQTRVCEHIERFPYMISPYDNTEHRYLDAKLNVHIMYLFCKAYKNSPAKYSYYLKYFNENFNLSFNKFVLQVCKTVVYSLVSGLRIVP